MKTRVDRVLDETGNMESRAAKMDIDDLLKCADSSLYSNESRN